MSNCDEYLELISARLDGALSPEENTRLEEHLAGCPDCRALAEELSALHAAVAALPPVAPPPDLAGRVMEAVRADNTIPFVPGEAKARARRRNQWLATAAVLAVILVGAGALRPWMAGGNTSAPSADTAMAITAAGRSGAAAPADAGEGTPESAEQSVQAFSALEDNGAVSAVPEETAAPVQADATCGSGAGSTAYKAVSPTPAPTPAMQFRSAPTPVESISPELGVAPANGLLGASNDTAQADQGALPPEDSAEPAVQPEQRQAVTFYSFPDVQKEVLDLCAAELFPDALSDPAPVYDRTARTLTLTLPEGETAVLTCGETQTDHIYPVTCLQGEAVTSYLADLTAGTVTPAEADPNTP